MKYLVFLSILLTSCASVNGRHCTNYMWVNNYDIPNHVSQRPVCTEWSK